MGSDRELKEAQLEKEYLGKVISLTIPWKGQDITHTGKVNSIAYWDGNVIVMLLPALGKYEVDLDYFIENTIIHDGNNATGSGDSNVFGIV